MTSFIENKKVVELQGVTKHFRFASEEVTALRGVDLELYEEDMIAITGKSGAGKSTLLHLIATLDKPSSGTIRMNGYDLSKLSDQKISRLRNRSIGFVFQMNNLLAEFSALENIMMPGLIAGLEKQTVKSRAEQLLEAVELPHRASHRPGELSGGEQQRIAVARALLMTPAILLADEPTGNLDNKTSATIQELLFSLCQHYKITMLLVTHDEALARKMPQRIVMEDGCIIDRG